MPSLSVNDLLAAIAALPEAERRDLLVRLRERYGSPPPPRQAEPDWSPPPGAEVDEDDWTALAAWEADYLLVFDGGSRGNPGEGYGSFAVFGRPLAAGEVVRLTFPGTLTNNEAEYQTLLAGLQALLGALGLESAQASSLEVRGDSQLVIQQVLGHWRAQDDRMRALRDEARQLLGEFGRWRLVAQPRADTLKVLGH